MFVARWQIDARFGHKQVVVESLQKWEAEIGGKAGFPKGRIITGSIGALEATIEHEFEVASLADLEAMWTKIAKVEAHKEWSKSLEPHVVSGSTRWTIFRVL
jgi:hypothetical protein